MPRAVPIRTDMPSAELRRRAEIEADGRASRRMLALAAAALESVRETLRDQGEEPAAGGPSFLQARTATRSSRRRSADFGCSG